MSHNYKFEISFSDIDNQYRFKIVTFNNKIILQSGGYHNLKDCIDVVNVIKNHASTAKVVHKYYLKDKML